ncbi:16S rRNA (cytosine(1402)-N(4))-methyltransferase RsmH [Candidatus Omnitrophota bacterium]
MTKSELHTPVMCREAINYLNLEQGATVLDCTVGLGGHTAALLRQIGPEGRLIGLDQDQQSLELVKNKLNKFANCSLIQANFRKLDQILIDLGMPKVDGIIFDLGLSSLQLETKIRGFSFRLEAPLDMRMDQQLRVSAFDLVNFLPQEGLSSILRRYGQERWHNRIARGIVRERKKAMIATTRQLADLIQRAVPRKYSAIHPATRTFQALRIAVNDELEALAEGLTKAIDFVKAGGRICVISFHSLEDRIVKHQFRDFAKQGRLKILTKKPIRPEPEELAANPRARSAKLRAAEKI